MENIIDDLLFKPLDAVGFYGHNLLFILTMFILVTRYRWSWLIIYLLGYYVNQYLNVTLKLIIQEKRPTNSTNFVPWEYYNNGHQYGMPSGHAQSVFYSLTFCYCVLRSVEWFYFMIFIAGLTVFQRWKYRKHSILQLCVGGTLGSLFATLVYFVMDKYKKNGYSIYNVAK